MKRGVNWVFKANARGGIEKEQGGVGKYYKKRHRLILVYKKQRLLEGICKDRFEKYFETICGNS